MDKKENYDVWLEKTAFDQELQQELLSISGDDAAVKERFSAALKFGTAGMRAVIGAGTNRINIYTVGWTTQAFAGYIKAHGLPLKVAIAYDCRNYSLLFAEEAAVVFAANGIKVNLFPEIAPTPLLSYAVRELGCGGGVVITASHNRREYNGYKCYGESGCQINNASALEIQERMFVTDMFYGVKKVSFNSGRKQGLIRYIDDDLIEKYYNDVLKQSIRPDVLERANLKVLYTPLNGTGYKHVPEILNRAGINNISFVEEQSAPDGDFTTCPYPNPEFGEAFELALKKAETSKPDVILVTDPDCDRLGVAVKNGDGYTLLNGNEIGCLLAEYILSSRQQAGSLPDQPLLIRTVATGKLVDRIAYEYGCEVRCVQTGFKHIGEVIDILEMIGRLERFVLGYEESHGYLAGSYVRDKDAVLAALLVSEMVCYYKTKGETLCDALDEIYREYGYYLYSGKSYENFSAKEQSKFMNDLRVSPPHALAGRQAKKLIDYRELTVKDLISGEKSPFDFDPADLLSLSLAEGSEVLIRPSGTEPKLKIYFTAYGSTKGEACQLLDRLKEDMDALWQAKINSGEKDEKI